MAEDIESVPVTISPAIQDKLLPFSFLETQLYERMSQLLTGYMSVADVRYMMSEIKGDLFSGFTTMDTKKLHTMVHHCKKCPNMKSTPVIPSWNCIDPDLLVLVDNPYTVERYGEILFSDLKKAGFSSQRCMLTHTVRCNAIDITQQNVDNCVPYLHTEVAITNPKLIITLGLSAFQNFTGDTHSKLNDIKGIIRSWGTYFILPEISLGSLYHMKKKEQGATDSLFLSLQKAHDYLYAGGLN